MSFDAATIEKIRATVIDLAIRFGPKVAVALLIMAVGVILSRSIARRAEQTFRRLDMEPPVRQLLARLLRTLVLGLFAIMALQNLGVEMLPLLAGLGVAGAGVALATQGVLSNVVAGLTIIFTKPYRVVVPNRKIGGEILHNYGRIRQCELSVGMAYEADLAAARALVHEIVKANARVLAEPAPLVQASTLADSAVLIAVKPWVAVPDFGTVEGELYVAIVEGLRQRGISIPYPQREIRLLKQENA